MSNAAVDLPSSTQGEFSLGDLDADNIKTVEETKARIQGNLHSSRDPGLLNAMVDYYLKTRSPACLQILSSIHEARAQVSWYVSMWQIGLDCMSVDEDVCRDSACLLLKGIIWENERLPATLAFPFGHLNTAGTYCAKTGKCGKEI